ncbi:MAG: hypothetical protein AB1715_12750, partial [Acidobacteriota bacterium]
MLSKIARHFGLRSEGVFFCSLLVAMGLLRPGADGRATAEGPLSIRHVTVIDGMGAAPRANQTVIISGDRIVEIGEDGSVSLPEEARILDGEGRYLIPGVWDMHVHLSQSTESALPALVANGIVGVRDMGGFLPLIDRWRVLTEAGLMTGPRIVRPGPTVNGQAAAEWHLPVETAEQARGAVRALHKAGVDFIKIHNALSREAYFALAGECSALGTKFCGHIPKTVSPEEAVEAGQASLEHTETLFEGTFSANLKQEKLLEA